MKKPPQSPVETDDDESPDTMPRKEGKSKVDEDCSDGKADMVDAENDVSASRTTKDNEEGEQNDGAAGNLQEQSSPRAVNKPGKPPEAGIIKEVMVGHFMSKTRWHLESRHCSPVPTETIENTNVTPANDQYWSAGWSLHTTVLNLNKREEPKQPPETETSLLPWRFRSLLCISLSQKSSNIAAQHH